MRVPDWRTTVFDEGVLPEPVADENRIVVWLPEPSVGPFQSWQRVGSVAGAEVVVEQGICVTPAVAIRARQRIIGRLGRLFQHFRGATSDRAMILPNGESAEPCGGR